MTFHILLACLAAASTVGPAGPPPHRSDAAAAVLAAERAWVDAIERRDARALAGLLADDFVDTSWQGRLRTRTDMLTALRTAPSNQNLLSDLTVSVHDDSAIVRGLNTVRAPGGANIGSVRFTDVFIHRGRSWRAVAAQETPVR